MSRWLERERLRPDELTSERVEAFVAERRAAGYSTWLSVRSVALPLEYLRECGVVPVAPASVVDDRLAQLLVGYTRYLFDERGLTEHTSVSRLLARSGHGFGTTLSEPAIAGRAARRIQRGCCWRGGLLAGSHDRGYPGPERERNSARSREGTMSEEHQIVGLARGEPLPEGRVGVCLRFPLSGTPSARWSRDLTARLGVELTGRAAVGHLRLNQIVHGPEIVLEGVESDEASHIAGAVERAVDAANDDCADNKHVDEGENDPQTTAHALAREVAASQRRVNPDHPDVDAEA